MTDYAEQSRGTYVSMATCCDDGHPPECVIDGNPKTFWSTTGLFPQEIVLTLKDQTRISRVTFSSTGVQKLVVSRARDIQPLEFEKLYDTNLSQITGQMQQDNKVISFEAKHVKFTLQSGWDNFAAVHKISLQ
ncbi:intraflagellar transport protein 25 [Chloropicon roscoffensis]|uniref:Intraflagellar transport protein 25 n=1 Tax=Chloropicon roscoffensis TaxID=1461544 RepID=A0AAX4P9I4_9CHLO